MEEGKLKTFFAPSERVSDEVIKEQSKIFFEGEIFKDFSSAVPGIYLILNEFRQVVFANTHLSELFGLSSKECLLGKRPGEVFNCAYARKNEGGCGTSEFCRHCGAVRSIMKAINGISNVDECSIITEDNDAINLRVWAVPFTLNKEKYVAFSVTDITKEKMYQNLQRTFFHDIVNIAGAISGLAELLSSSLADSDSNNYIKMLQESTKKLLAEIETQREMSKICQGEFNVTVDTFSTLDFLKFVINLYLPHEVAKGKSIFILPTACDIIISSDETLLLRVIGNMTKNALESSNGGGAVSLNCVEQHDSVVFSVNNRNFIPKEVQLQIFKRFFSTKGKERGLGTYSMKLIGENSLHGKVYFESNESDGTTFFIKIPKVL